MSVTFELVHAPHEPSGLVTVTDRVMTCHHRVVSAKRYRAVEVVDGVVADLVGGANTAEQILVEMFAESFADKVQSDGIDAGVYVTEAEPDDAKRVPEVIVVVM